MSANREVRRLEAELAEFADREEWWEDYADHLNLRLHVLAGQYKRSLSQLTAKVVVAENELEDAILWRVAAQQKLADNIRTPCHSCGKAWRPPHQREIGYEPKTDRGLRRFFINRPLRERLRALIAEPQALS